MRWNGQNKYMHALSTSKCEICAPAIEHTDTDTEILMVDNHSAPDGSSSLLCFIHSSTLYTFQ